MLTCLCCPSKSIRKRCWDNRSDTDKDCNHRLSGSSQIRWERHSRRRGLNSNNCGSRGSKNNRLHNIGEADSVPSSGCKWYKAKRWPGLSRNNCLSSRAEIFRNGERGTDILGVKITFCSSPIIEIRPVIHRGLGDAVNFVSRSVVSNRRAGDYKHVLRLGRLLHLDEQESYE